MGTQHSVQCVHIKRDGDRCANHLNINYFTDPDTATCHVHGKVRNLREETLVQAVEDSGGSITKAYLNKEEEMNKCMECGADTPNGEDENHFEAHCDRCLETSICVFGHRDFMRRHLALLREELLPKFWERAKEKYGQVSCLTGGANGGDRIGAASAHKQDVPFDIELPHEHYHLAYNATSEWVKPMMGAARAVNYTIGKDKPWHWSFNFARNRAMAEKADIFTVISPKSIKALLGQKRGGTTHMLKTLRDQGTESVIHIDPSRGTITVVKL